MSPAGPTFSVAMATFNGARYLREQLDSIARQSYLPTELIIGDDRSTDDTVAIIEDFSRTAPFPVHLTINPVNLGYGDNFLETAARCRCDWIAFSDQDDVWCENKLELMQRAIAASKADDLVMVLHQARAVDERLMPLADGMPLPHAPTHTVTPRRGHKCFWAYKGMAQVVRREVIAEFDRHCRPQAVYDRAKVVSHDDWTSLIANAIGSTHYVDEACLLYRRHDTNVSPLSGITQRTAADVIERAVRANLEDFGLRAEASTSFQRSLEAVAETAPHRHRIHLLQHAADYRRHHDVLRNRMAVLSDRSVATRLRMWMQTVRAGGYSRSNNFGFTRWAMLKDLAMVLRF